MALHDSLLRKSRPQYPPSAEARALRLAARAALRGQIAQGREQLHDSRRLVARGQALLAETEERLRRARAWLGTGTRAG